MFYPITVQTDENSKGICYIAKIPQLPGCMADGQTIEEALESLEEAKELYLETLEKYHQPIPDPVYGGASITYLFAFDCQKGVLLPWKD